MGVSVFPAAGGGVTQKVQDFTSTGSFVTPSNVTSVQVILVGGGGGAGYVNNPVSANTHNAGGGGGGEYIENFIPVTAGTTYTVTIGAGGAASTVTTSAGGIGTNTTFGSLLTAVGGGGGGSHSNVTSTHVSPTRGGGGFNFYSPSSGGGGGGAGGPAVWSTATNDTSVTVYGLKTINTSTRVPNIGTPVFNDTGDNYVIAGPGKNGFGNGGLGSYYFESTGSTQSGSGFYSGSGIPGTYNGATSTRTAATAPTANTGDGGHGNPTLTTTNSGLVGTAGASGYARVIYWS